jgi:hypothetical protein
MGTWEAIDAVQEAIVRSLQLSKKKLLQAVGTSQHSIADFAHGSEVSNLQGGSCAFTTRGTNACITFFQ